MTTLLISLILAAISAITFLAYKHPNAYARLHMPLFFISTLVCGVLIAWNGGISSAATKIRALTPPDGVTYTPVIDAISNLEFGGISITVTYLGVVIYLSFLLCLPQLLKEDEKKK
jgi:hypothetical protein